MAAIGGIIAKQRIDLSGRIQKMIVRMQHRSKGGCLKFENNGCALAQFLGNPQKQTKLFSIEEKDAIAIITADVHLDNRNELAGKLAISSLDLPNFSDEQLILFSYQRWQTDCVKQLKGEFAFAIWDEQKQEFFAAVDPIGFRPFYYCDDADAFLFCSEIKGVEAAKITPNYFDDNSLLNYLYRSGDSWRTYNRAIFALNGGHYLLQKKGILTVQRYWKMESTGKYAFKKDSDWYECTRDLVIRAIEKRLIPDARVGITLSGGLDSSAIAGVLATMLQKKNQPLYAFSSVLPVGYKGIEKDERYYINLVNKKYPNIIQTWVEAPNKGPFSEVEEAFELDERFPNCFHYMDRALLEAAQNFSVKVSFSGFGGDNWISNGGYGVIYRMIRYGAWAEAYLLIRQLSVSKQRSFRSLVKQHYAVHTQSWQLLKKIVKHADQSINWQDKAFLNPSIEEKWLTLRRNRVIKQPMNAGIIKFINNGLIGERMRMWANRYSQFDMAPAVPFFDLDLLQLLLDVPERLLLENGRTRNLIREAMRDFFPDEIYSRTDKLPYSPAFPQRLLAQQEILKQNFSNLPNCCKTYFNKGEILENIKNIKSFKGFGQSKNIIDLRVANACIACFCLKKLERCQYNIAV